MTKPQSEFRAYGELLAQGFETFFPRCLSTKGRIEPLFPRYLFVLVRKSWSTIRNTRGVSSVVMCGDQPGKIPTNIILGLQTISHSDPQEVIQLPVTFHKGQVLRTKDFHHIASQGELIYQGMVGEDRVRVLWTLFGRSTDTTLPLSDVVAA